MTPLISFAHETSRIDVDTLQVMVAQRDLQAKPEQPRDEQGQFKSNDVARTSR